MGVVERIPVAIGPGNVLAVVVGVSSFICLLAVAAVPVCAGGVDALLPVGQVLGAAGCVLPGFVTVRAWLESCPVSAAKSCIVDSTLALACFDDPKPRGGVISKLPCAAAAAAGVRYYARGALCCGARLGSVLLKTSYGSLSNVSGDATAGFIATHSNRLGSVIRLLEEMKAAFDRGSPSVSVARASNLCRSQILLWESASPCFLRLASTWVWSVVAFSDIVGEEVVKEVPGV